jgi:hypothetical protein
MGLPEIGQRNSGGRASKGGCGSGSEGLVRGSVRGEPVGPSAWASKTSACVACRLLCSLSHLLHYTASGLEGWGFGDLGVWGFGGLGVDVGVATCRDTRT